MSILCGLLAIGLLGYAAYRYTVEEGPPGVSLTVQDPDRDLGSSPCDATVAVSFRIANTSAQPVRIVGLVPG
jgi:hypothetical protein